MLTSIKQFFSVRMDVHDQRQQQPITMAVAALLIEVSRADYELGEAERQSVVDALVRVFDVPDSELQTLITLAETEVESAVSMFQFTQMVNEQYEYAQKLQLIEGMWRVAYADGDLDKYEDHLIRRVSDLIHVSHSDFIQRKLRVVEELGAG